MRLVDLLSVIKVGEWISIHDFNGILLFYGRKEYFDNRYCYLDKEISSVEYYDGLGIKITLRLVVNEIAF